LISSANTIITSAISGGEETDDIIDDAERRIFEIAEDKVKRGFLSIRDLAGETTTQLEELYERSDFVTGVSTGFKRLDNYTAGLQAGDLIIIAGRPSMGKTALALNIAQHVALRNDGSVGIFSLEMSTQQLVRRMISSEAQVDNQKINTGYLSKDELNVLVNTLELLASKKIFVDDAANPSLLEMRSKARRLKAEHGLDLLIIDYLQLMSLDRFENRNLEIGAISRALKGLAKELEVPVIALSQLSRAPEARSRHRPQLSDLRESGNLEQDADVVSFIYREEVYSPEDKSNAGEATLIIAKQRNGPIGDVSLVFLKQFTTFKDRDDRDDPGEAWS
jgi:replicative DNA helicase